MVRGPCAPIQSSRSDAISPRKQFGSGKSHVICELQRLQFSSPEAIRLVREMWEILRRKKGCTLNRLYRSSQEDQRWLAYSEWTSLAELAGARREAARSPLNRRLHSMLAASSERAFEPFGAVRSVQGVNFAAAPAALLIEASAEMEQPEAAFNVLAEQPGYISHVLMHQVGNAAALACLAHFDCAENAGKCARQLPDLRSLRDLKASAELYLT
jgi:quinol monooxygenase YgiN